MILTNILNFLGYAGRQFMVIAAVLLIFLSPTHAFRILDDPLQTERKIEPFGKQLHPDICPSNSLDEEHVISLAEAVALALCHNPDTQAGYISLMAQAAGYGSSQSALFPSGTLSASAGRSANFSKGGDSISENSGLSASLSYTLFDFGRKNLSVWAAEQSLLAAGHSYASSMQGVIATTLQSYYNLLAAHSALEVAEESRRFSEASLEAATLRYTIGQAPLSDKLQAEASFTQSTFSKEQAENQLAISRAALAVQLGFLPDAPITIAELDEQQLVDESVNEDIGALMELAKKQRPDLAARYAQLEGSEASLKALKRADLPNVTLSAGQNFSDIDVFNNTTLSSQSLGVSVNLSIPIGFSQSYSEKASELQLQAQKLQLQQTEHNVMQDVWRAWHGYKTSQQNWTTTNQQLKSATQLKNVSIGRYKEGVGTILDVLNAQSQYRGALQNRVQTKNNLLNTRIELIRALGSLNLSTYDISAKDNPLGGQNE